MSDIVVYEPLHVVKTFSWDKYYIKSSNYDIFTKTIEQNKYVDLNGELIAVSSIESVKRANSDLSMVETMISNKPDDIKEKVREIVEKRKKEWMKISEAVILNIIEKYE